MNCPCQSGQHYEQCCGRFISHRERPENAEQLMRSRYCAFHLGQADYLLETWHPEYRPDNVDADTQIRWLGLDVIHFEQGEQQAKVEFEVRLLVAGRIEGMHELSSFEHRQDRWLYTTGDVLAPSFAPSKPSRNEACPCASGKKYNRCCANG